MVLDSPLGGCGHRRLNLFTDLIAVFAEQREGTIQYGYRKCGVFPQAFAHGNCKNEIRHTVESEEEGEKS